MFPNEMSDGAQPLFISRQIVHINIEKRLLSKDPKVDTIPIRLTSKCRITFLFLELVLPSSAFYLKTVVVTVQHKRFFITKLKDYRY